MFKKAKVTDQTAAGQGKDASEGDKAKKKEGIKRRSKVPGVMITQYIEDLPEGKSTPDFLRKPIALTIQEGKLALFKAKVSGDPKPELTWTRAKGDLTDTARFQQKYEEASGEYTLVIPKVSGEDADTYKCYAQNEYGKAVVTAILNVIEVGYKKSKALQVEETADPTEFRKMLRKRAGKEKEEQQRREGGVDDKFWDLLMSSDKKDYEGLCNEFGVTDFRWMLKKLNEIKKEREEEQKMYVETISNLKHIEVKGDGLACFSIDMELTDPNSRIFLYKDGVMIPYSEEMDQKHSLKRIGKSLVFSVRDLKSEDAGLYQIDVEEVNMFSTEFKIPTVDFVAKIQEVKAQEREDAVFECVLTHPLPKIQWLGRNSTLEDGEKYTITVSEDKLIHRLLIKDCLQLDKGIYTAVAGIKTCSAWLIVEADTGAKGKKAARKTTQAGGGADLEKLAREQQEKLAKEREEEIKKRQQEDAERRAREEMEARRVKDQAELDRLAQEERDRLEAERRRALEARGILGGAGDGSADGSGSGKGAGGKGTGGDGSTDGSGKGKGRGGGSGDGSGDGTGKGFGKGSGDGSGGDGSDKDGKRGGRDSDASRLKGKGAAGSGRGDGTDGEGNGDGSGKDGKLGKGNGLNAGAGAGADGDSLKGDGTDPDADKDEDENEKDKAARRAKRQRQGDLVPDKVVDPGVQFVVGLSNVTSMLGQPAELMCKVSSEQCEGTWFKDGRKITDEAGISVSKDGACHKLVIDNCQEEHSGRYRFEAEGRKSEAIIAVQDPPRFVKEELEKFSCPITVKAGQSAVFKLPFEGHEPSKIQWYRKGEELLDEPGVKIEISPNQSRLLLNKCTRKQTGEIKIRIKNEYGTVEAVTQLVVLDKPTAPQGPVETVESSGQCVEIKWRAPKDDGGMPIKNYILERQQIGRNTWTKIGEIPGNPTYKDTNVELGRKYCYRIQAITEQGVSEVMETEDIQAGTLAFPSQPAAPKVVSAFNDCINLTWTAPSDTGGAGSRIVGYNLEKRKKGSNLWSQVNPAGEPIQGKKYAVKDVVAGVEYEFRVIAINLSGPSEPSHASPFVIARDPKKPPGKVLDLKLTETTYNTVSLSWSKPEERKGIQDEPKGYFVEVRPAESLEWLRSNTTPVILTSYMVKGLKSMAMYWVRVIATNEGGDSEPADLENYIMAMPPPVRPKFTTRNMQSFMVVRAGNTLRINLAFEASPWPDVEWEKDGMHVSKRATISNSDTGSQILIPSSERSDTGIYTIVVKNMVGQETFSIEVRVTDEPKPPGPIELEENVPGTVTVNWEPSIDEKRDDRLHYCVSQRDSTKRTWHMVADRLFNRKFTACNIMQGREYHFRVYAKNDMGMSAPSESPTWGTTRQKEKFVVAMPDYRKCDFQCAPSFTAPLKVRVAPKGYECYMTCAVKGNPFPRITWYHNNVSLNTNTNYLITNTCGVCSILILRVAPRDIGEYMVTAENGLGRAETATSLTVRD